MLASIKNHLLAILVLSTTQYTFAGTGLETTRVIFFEKDRNQSVVAFNTDKKTSYLAQSWIENEQGKLTPDFITTPPIVKLRAEQKNTIQITKNVVLPPEHETLYWMNVKFIPPVTADAENILKFSMTHRIKLIYRPDVLSKQSLEDEVKKLTWEIQNNQLILNNPTAFYINFAKIEVDHKDIKAPNYIAPYSQNKIALASTAKQQSQVDITYINDYGKSILLKP